MNLRYNNLGRLSLPRLVTDTFLLFFMINNCNFQFRHFIDFLISKFNLSLLLLYYTDPHLHLDFTPKFSKELIFLLQHIVIGRGCFRVMRVTIIDVVFRRLYCDVAILLIFYGDPKFSLAKMIFMEYSRRWRSLMKNL